MAYKVRTNIDGNLVIDIPISASGFLSMIPRAAQVYGLKDPCEIKVDDIKDKGGYEDIKAGDSIGIGYDPISGDPTFSPELMHIDSKYTIIDYP